MLDDTFVAEKVEATNYEPIPDEMYQVELLDVSSKETETYDSKKARAANSALVPEMETVLDFQFVLLNGDENGKSLRGRNLFHNYVPSYLYIGKKGKNALYQIVEALQAQTVSPEQEAYGITGKELNALVGKQCRVLTKNETKGDKVYSNIDNFLIAKEQLAPLTAEEKEAAKIKPKEATAVANAS